MKSNKAGASAPERRIVAEMILKNGGPSVTHEIFATERGLMGVPLRDIDKPDLWRKVDSVSGYVGMATQGNVGKVDVTLAVAENPNDPQPALIRRASGELGFILAHLRELDLLCTGTSQVAVPN